MCLTEEYLSVAFDDAMADVGQGPAAYADGMYLCYVICDGAELRHRSERLSFEVEVQSCYDDACASAGKFVAYADNLFVKELCLVNTQDVRIGPHEQYAGSTLHRRGGYGVAFVADDVFLAVAHVNGRLEDLHFLFGELGALHAAYEFFSLSGEHRAADDFYAASPHEFSTVIFLIWHSKNCFSGAKLAFSSLPAKENARKSKNFVNFHPSLVVE